MTDAATASNSPRIFAVFPLPCGQIIHAAHSWCHPRGCQKKGISEKLVSFTGACSGWKQCKCTGGFPRNRAGVNICKACAQIPLFLPLQRYSPCSQPEGAWQGARSSRSPGISLRSQCRSLLQVTAETCELYFFKYNLALTAKFKRCSGLPMWEL